VRAAAALGAVLLTAACAPTYPVVGQNAPVEPRAEPAAPAPQPQIQTPPPAAPPPRSPIPQASAPRRDQCGAAEVQNLVGRPRTEVPVPLDPRRQRVACTTCPPADDVDPTRLNFLFDPQSGRIRQIRCG
jgi:hypothetical protein